MIKLAQNSRESQQTRLKIKTLSQQMQTIAVHGTGLSPWEGKSPWLRKNARNTGKAPERACT